MLGIQRLICHSISQLAARGSDRKTYHNAGSLFQWRLFLSMACIAMWCIVIAITISIQSPKLREFKNQFAVKTVKNGLKR
jgi:hypothetical protein